MNKVKPDESGSDPDLEEEATEVNQILEDPSPDNFSVHGVLCFDKDNTGKCLGIDDFNGEAVCGGLGTNSGAITSYITQEPENELNLGVLDGILDEIDEDLDYADGLSGGCEDYLLDVDLVQEVSALNSGLCDGIRLGNSSSDSHSPGYSGSSNGAVGMSDSSALTNSDISYKDELYQKSSYNLSYGASRIRGRRSRNNRDKTRKFSYDSGRLAEFRNDEKFPDCHPSVKNENSPEVLGNVREKRQRKPPQRYIEESSNIKPKHRMPGHRFSAVVSKVNYLKVGSPDGQHHATARLSGFVADDVKEPYGGGSTQRQVLKKHSQVMEFAPVEDLSGTESEQEFSGEKSNKKSGSIDRRKHQRMWTVQEVINLVDGISKYGVGRWTDIKRLSFASAAYRTPIDLRDKWRNLLRASRAHKFDKEENDQRQSSVRPLPKSLLRRVHELATIHPYPRTDRSRSSPSPSTSAKESSRLSSLVGVKGAN